jgi:branched-chain amino acid transport system permease protein
LSQLISSVNTVSRQRFGASFFGLVFLAAIFAALFSAAPAHAADDPSTYAYTIGGTLLNGDKPIAGVTITATEDGGKFKGTVKSDAGGSWIIMVPDPKIYTVTLDTATLPTGVGLTKAQEAVQKADLTNSQLAGILFSFGKNEVQTVDFATQFWQKLYDGLNFGLMLALASIGVSLIFGTTGLSNFAHGELVTFGALILWLLESKLELNVFLAVPLTVAIGGLFGYVQDRALWKPLRKRRLGTNQMMIVSIGLSIVLSYLMLLFFGGDLKTIGAGGNPLKLGSIQATDIGVISMVIAVLALGLIAFFLTRTRLGKATRAVSDNASLASATGIDVEQIIRIVWIAAAAVTALAGALYGLQFQATWQTGSNILLLLFASVTLGGLGTTLGATVGALIIGLTVQLATFVIPNDMKYASALVILILILIVRPQGILGKKQRIG